MLKVLYAHLIVFFGGGVSLKLGKFLLQNSFLTSYRMFHRIFDTLISKSEDENHERGLIRLVELANCLAYRQINVTRIICH